MYGYESLIRAGWKTGVHDVRGCRYQHPYVALHRASGSAVGCWSRREARDTLRRLKQGRRSAVQTG